MHLLHSRSVYFLSLIFLLALALPWMSSACASATPASYVPSSTWLTVATMPSEIPPEWTDLGAAPPSFEGIVHVNLFAADPGAVGRAFDSVTDPSSPHYQKYLSQDEVRRLGAASDTAQRTVQQWIDSFTASAVGAASGALHVENTGDSFKLRGGAAALAGLFNVVSPMHLFSRPDASIGTNPPSEHSFTVVRLAPGDSASVPSDVRPLVESVMGLADFPPRIWHSHPAHFRQGPALPAHIVARSAASSQTFSLRNLDEVQSHVQVVMGEGDKK